MSDKPVVKVSVSANNLKEVKRLWDNYQEIGSVQKSDCIKFIVGAGVRDGVRYINVREFYLRKRDNTWMPGRDGITIPIRVPIEKGTKLLEPYMHFVDMLDTALLAVRDMELYDKDKAVYIERKKK